MPIIKYTSDGERVQKQKEYQRAYYAKNKERIQAANRARYVPMDEAVKKKCGRPKHAALHAADDVVADE